MTANIQAALAQVEQASALVASRRVGQQLALARLHLEHALNPPPEPPPPPPVRYVGLLTAFRELAAEGRWQPSTREVHARCVGAVSVRAVQRACREACRRGDLTQDGHGRYGLADRGTK